MDNIIEYACFDGDVIEEVDEVVCVGRIKVQNIASWEFLGHELRHKSTTALGSIQTQMTENGQVIAISTRNIRAGRVVLTEKPFWKVDKNEISPEALYQCELIANDILLQTKDEILSEINFDGSIFHPALALRSKTQQYEILYGQYCPSVNEVPSVLYQCLQNGIDKLFQKQLLQCDIVSALTCTLVSISNFFECEINEHGQGSSVMALCRAASRLNHSCRPNCWFYFENGRLILRALVDIQKGQELTHSYLESERWSTFKERRKILKSTKFFVCNCCRCLEEESLSHLKIHEKKATILTLEKLCNVSSPLLNDILLNWSTLNGNDINVLVSNYSEICQLISQCVDVDDHIVRPVMLKFHELFYDLHKFSLNWQSAAHHMKMWIKCLQYSQIDCSVNSADETSNVGLFDRPSNRSAWMKEHFADALAASLSCPLDMIFIDDVQLLQHLLQSPSSSFLSPQATTSVLPKPCIAEVKYAYQSAISELALVYGVDLQGGTQDGDRPEEVQVDVSSASKSRRMVTSLQLKATRILKWIRQHVSDDEDHIHI